MSFLGNPRGIPHFADLDRRARAEPRDDRYVTNPAKPDLYSDPGIQAAIKQREAQVVAQHTARHAAGAAKRIEAIEQRIFNQVASVGGVRHGK